MDSTLAKKISALTEISKSGLATLFNAYPGPKDLILEPCIIRPLERICGVQWLKSHHIQKIYKLDATAPPPTFPSALQFYILYTDFHLFDLLQTYVQHSTINHTHVIFVPKAFRIHHDHFLGAGLHESVLHLHPFHWMPIELDHNVLSLEMPAFYKRLYVHHDLSLLPVCARTLWMLAFVFGRPKFILALGHHSNTVLKHWDVYCRRKGDVNANVQTDFGALVVLDRDLDYASTLLTPTTYSSLLHDVYGVECGVCEHTEDKPRNANNPNANQAQSNEKSTTKKHHVRFELNSSRDALYNEIKHCYFTQAIAILRNAAKEMRTHKETQQTMNLAAMKQYIANELQSATARKRCLAQHLAATETIVRVVGPRFDRVKQLEHAILHNGDRATLLERLDEIALLENEPLLTLRLFCLIALTQKLCADDIRPFLLQFRNAFGLQYGCIAHNMIRAGLLTHAQITDGESAPDVAPLTANFFPHVTRLKQVPGETTTQSELRTPTCPSYVFHGHYIPLIAQLILAVLKGSVEEMRNRWGALGPFGIRSETDGYPLTLKRILVYVVGGVTYAEIAACNLLETLTGCHIVVCSDRIISGNDVAQAMLHLYD